MSSDLPRAMRVGRFLPPRSRAVAALSALVVAGSLASAVAPSSASETTDRNKINALEQRLTTEGDKDEALVSHYNQVALHLASLQHEIAANSASLTRDHQSVAVATTHVRQWAVDAYIAAVSGESTTASFFGSSASSSRVGETQTYLGITSGSLDDAVSVLQVAEHRTTSVDATLIQERAATIATLNELASSRAAAEAGIARDDALLGSIKGNLLALVTAAAARRERAQAIASERALAQAAQAATVTGPQPTSHVAPGNYANPLRDLRGISPERVDQGVDYQGFGPIYAIGGGVVLSTVVGGWPGGTYISYRLDDGPAAGLVVYAAEDIQPTVSVGQHVGPNTVIGQVYEGYTGIETGWSDGAGDGTTMAADNRQYYGGNSTAFGANFSALLESLGAPGGQIENSPPTGSLPGGWPNW